MDLLKFVFHDMKSEGAGDSLMLYFDFKEV